MKKKTTEDFKNQIKLLDDDYELTPNSVYINDSTPIEFLHKSCNKTFMMRPGKFLGTKNTKGNRCPYCYGTPKKTLEDIKNEALNYNCEVLSNKYINNKENLTFRCLECDNIFEMPYNRFSKKDIDIKCPECRKKNRKSNKTTNKIIIKNSDSINDKKEEILNFIKSIYNGNIKIDFKIKEFKIDFYIPEYKIAFDFDNLYYHSEKFISSKTYHLDKTIFCKNNDIRLIHIFEDEWDNKQEIVKDKITYLLKRCNNKVYARKCEIVLLDRKDKGKFLNENHIQGNDSAQISLGLKYNDKIVACMTFCKQRICMYKKTNNIDKSNNYELSRYTTLKNHSVIGGFSKLFKYFINNYECNYIITYADMRWSLGDVYEELLTYSHTARPDYFYLSPEDRTKRLHRYQFRKTSIKEKFPEIYSDEKTEREMMLEAGYLRVYGCGNLVYIWERK